MATYVLIPGGGGDPWEWHRLVPELVSRGHDAIAVRLPAEDDTARWSEYADTVGPARREYHASLGLSAAETEDDGVIYYHDLPSEVRAEAQGADVAGPVDDAAG